MTTKCQSCNAAKATREMLGIPEEFLPARFCRPCADRLQAAAARQGNLLVGSVVRRGRRVRQAGEAGGVK